MAKLSLLIMQQIVKNIEETTSVNKLQISALTSGYTGSR